MRKRLIDLLDKRYLPRWIVLLADMGIILGAFFFTYLLRYNLVAQDVNIGKVSLQVMFILPFFLLSQLIFKPYRGILRHSTIHDLWVVLRAQLITSAGLFVISETGRQEFHYLIIPYSVIIVHFVLSVFGTMGFRMLVIYVFHNLLEFQKDKVNVFIFGAGNMGLTTRQVIEQNTGLRYHIAGFIDDNRNLWNSSVSGVKVYSFPMAKRLIKRGQHIQELIIAIPHYEIDLERKRKVVDYCLAHQISVKEVPDPSTWLDGKFSGTQIRNIRIEDLLGRAPISLSIETVANGVAGKRIMVTGGAGSIGSEIVRQLAQLNPQKIILVDQAESALYDIQNEILAMGNEIEFQVFVADVTNEFKMRKIFTHCHPEIIFHAAAYKHVPLMEHQPYEAVYNNIGGTKTLADLAVEFKVKKFVMVSTDKAVNPTNIMGATKRICEIYIQSLSMIQGIKTQFITTRFGNVLGSNGSVIPLFKRQISQGGPVTLTHKDIIRYFMTIPEACQLVMEAGFMGNGGEIYLFDMGKPIRIYDLAVKMISLSGFIPHKDIEILEVGLRPGEKLYEELLTDKEETLPTRHKKIMAAKIRPYPYAQSLSLINLLLDELDRLSEIETVSLMKKIVPEFVSNNSRFEVLDIKPESQIQI